MNNTQFNELQSLSVAVELCKARLYELMTIQEKGTFRNTYIVNWADSGIPDESFMFLSYEKEYVFILIESLIDIANARLKAAEQAFQYALTLYSKLEK